MGCGAITHRAELQPTGVVPAKGDAGQEDEPSSSLSGASPSGPSGSSTKNRSSKRVQKLTVSNDTEDVRRSPSMQALTEPNHDISKDERQFLSKALQRHFLFSSLEDEERHALIGFLHMQTFRHGEKIFSQGDKANCFYVIQRGTFVVSIDDVTLKQLKAKHTFGELALLYNMNRTATVSCSQDGILWRLDEKSFKEFMEKLRNKHFAKVRSFFDVDPTFKSLKVEEKDMLSGICSVHCFQRGETILREGEVGDWMFIIMQGSVSTVDQYGNVVVKMPGTILGISGLMYTKRQIHGAKAIDTVTCISLGKSAVERLMGPVEQVLRRSGVKALAQSQMSDGGQSHELEFFKKLTDDQQNVVIDNLAEATYSEGEVITTRGATAQLLIVIEGEIAVIDGDCSPCGAAQQREFAREVLSAGFSYGGRSLVEDAKMVDHTVALSTVRVHQVGAGPLRSVFGESLKDVIRLNEIKQILSDVFLFKSMTEDQFDHTIRALKTQRYNTNCDVVTQGEDAKHFFLIQSGAIRVLKDGIKLRSLAKWDYFGERGLLMHEKRSATCQAESPTTCLVLDAARFRDIVGLFEKDLKHRMKLQDLDISMADLRLLAIVGRGTFGTVKLVRYRDDAAKVYALKCVSKEQVLRQSQQKGLLVERDINAQCYHPCIVQFIKTFQDAKDIYFLTEFLGGGDLFFAIREIGDMTKEQVSFYTASIALALEHLHGRGIMYRDLKPENVLLDFDGNCKLTDFGCCKKSMKSATVVGTPEYLAPEVILGKGYTFAVDWWALGVMIHEFIVGPLPFGKGTEDQLELFREILEEPLQIPLYIDDESAIGIISGLLDRTPELRLGSSTRGAKEIKEHSYFDGFDWVALVGRYMTPPWKPDTEALKANWETFEGTPIQRADEEPFHKEDNLKIPGMEWAIAF